MPGACDGEAQVEWVVDSVHTAGREPVPAYRVAGRQCGSFGCQAYYGVVEQGQEFVGLQVEQGQGMDRGPQLAHRRDGVNALTHHVADCEGFLPPSEADARIGLDVLRSIISETGRPLSDLRDEAVHTLDPTTNGESECDAILLLVPTHTLDPDQVALWDLPADPAAVAAARARVHAQLVLWDLEDLSFSTELIVSELATNAFRYGAPPVQIRLIRDRSLTLEVSDSSAAAPHPRHARTHQ